MPHQFSAKLMNDTKWREVLTLVGQLSIGFEVAYIGGKGFQFGAISSLELLGAHGIADPGIAGGPATYQDIFAIRLFRYAKKLNPITGSVSPDESLSQEFLSLAKTLGQLPIEVHSDFIYVNGYLQSGES